MTVQEVKELIAKWEAIDASLCRIRLNKLKEKITSLEAENYSLNNQLVRAQNREQATSNVNVKFVKAIILISFVAFIEGIYIFQTFFN